MNKKILAIALCLAMIFSMAACGGKTKDEVQGSSSSAKHDPIKVSIGYSSTDETVANVVRDQLTKNGFEVELKAFPDGASLKECQVNGTTDIQFFSWGNVVGTPDYGVHAVWASDGDANRNGYANAKVDELLIEASTLPLDKNQSKYIEIETIVVDEDCVWVPLYRNLSNLPHSVLLDSENFHPNARLSQYTYVDASQNETRPFVAAQSGSTFSTFDCVRANDSSTGVALDASYIMLTQLDETYQPITDGSLSRNFATAEDCQNFYFILRDDCYFSAVDKNMNVYQLDTKVGAEDVEYSLYRACHKTSVPVHQTYSMFSTMEGATIVTDLSELESVKDTNGKSIREVLEAGITPISSLTANKNEANNANGVYQVVKVTTSKPFPQILNNLSHHGAGIVDSEYVKECNKNFNYDTYNANTDKLYGDAENMREGANYANDLHCSGAYVLVSFNDYQMTLERNPGYYTSEPGYVKIKTVIRKFIADADAQLSALRSGEIDYIGTMPASKWDIVAQDSNLVDYISTGTRVYCMMFNMHGNSECSTNLNLRKAIASCINFEEIKAVLAGHAVEAKSFLSCCFQNVDTKNPFNGHTQEYLDAYWAEKEAK